MPTRLWILAVPCILAIVGCNDDDESRAGVGSGGSSAAEASGGSDAGVGGVSPGGTATAGGDRGAAGASDGNPTGDGSANVIAVTVTGSAEAYYFDVTLETTDVDCSHFADWWEVLSLDGALLYRRILAHPHTEGLSGNPFTRGGGPVEISADREVVVRAHLSDLGCIGVAQRGSPAGTFADASDIGADFAASVETEAPQPSECIPEEQMVGG